MSPVKRMRRVVSPLLFGLVAAGVAFVPACGAGEGRDGWNPEIEAGVDEEEAGGGGQVGTFDPNDPTPGGAVDAGEAGAGLRDAMPDADTDACTDEPYAPGPLEHNCRPPTDNECDGLYEHPDFPNGQYGNGLDDDCDGIVDEGCTCGPSSPIGTTKACYLVPPSQVDPVTKKPAGWCTENAKGTVTCIPKGAGEFVTGVWDGYCKGAQQPFADDVCAPGDFDCDGRDSNSKSLDCGCVVPPVECPTAPIVTSPYPDLTNLTKKKNNPLDPSPTTPFIINGHQWITGANPADATNWKWTVVGGDCDNILPHPTFAIYNGPNANTAARIGTASSTLGSGNQSGFVVGGPGSTQNQIWPAFALSGDYTVVGAFELDGEQHECSVKVQVRWPGLRTELCWDTVGNVDLDLHFARLQGTTCANHGWFATCNEGDGEDCHYGSGCKGTSGPSWGYATSADEACKGWGSKRAASERCFNPRLDRDNISCTRTQADPLNTGFCSPENINLDNPAVGDQFAIGVHHYGGAAARPHVNVYCNGERKLAFGYDPTTTPATMLPYLNQAGNSRAGGDFWSVARVTWLGASDPDTCLIEPVQSQNPRADRDGSLSAYCVDTGPRNGAASGQAQWHFASGGVVPSGAPPSPPQAGSWFCWH